MGTILAERLKAAHRSEDGSVLIEFAFSFVILIGLLFAVSGFALAMYSYQFVSYAAQQGAHYAIVRGAHWDANCSTTSSLACDATSSNVQDYVQTLSSGLIKTSSLSVQTTWPGTNVDGTSTGCTTSANSPGCLVDVTVSYPFRLSLPLIPVHTYTFSATSQMVIQE